MKRKDKMVRMTITVPSLIKRDMEKHPQINWSAVASDAFERRLRIEEAVGRLDRPGSSEEGEAAGADRDLEREIGAAAAGSS